MADKILLPSVKAVHSDYPDGGQSIVFMCEMLQKAEQRAFPGARRRSQHDKNAPALFLPDLRQFFEQRQKDFPDSPLTVGCVNADPVDCYLIINHVLLQYVTSVHS